MTPNEKATPDIKALAKASAEELISKLKADEARRTEAAKRELTVEEFRATPTGELADRIFREILKGVSRESADSLFLSAPPLIRSVYTLPLLDNEVSNGGFHQFFWNTDSRLNRLVEEDLRMIEADTASAIFAEAVRRAALCPRSRGWFRRLFWTWKDFVKGYSEQSFDDLESRYYGLNPATAELLERFLRANEGSVLAALKETRLK